MWICGGDSTRGLLITQILEYKSSIFWVTCQSSVFRSIEIFCLIFVLFIFFHSSDSESLTILLLPMHQFEALNFGLHMLIGDSISSNICMKHTTVYLPLLSSTGVDISDMEWCQFYNARTMTCSLCSLWLCKHRQKN